MKGTGACASVLGVVVAVILGAAPAQAAGTLDQSFELSCSGCYDGVISGVPKGQAVVPGMTGLLTSVDLLVSDSGPETSPLTASIYSASNGLPTGAPLASVALSPSSISVSDSWVSFAFSEPAEVTAGTPFVIVLTTLQDPTQGGYFWLRGTPAYSGGGGLTDAGSGWNGSAWTYSFNFRTYVSQEGATHSPTPLLQQFGRPEQVTCEASAPFSLNWGGAGSGGWGESWAQWMNGGAGGQVCTRTLVFDNAQGTWTAS